MIIVTILTSESKITYEKIEKKKFFFAPPPNFHCDISIVFAGGVEGGRGVGHVACYELAPTRTEDAVKLTNAVQSQRELIFQALNAIIIHSL